MNSENAIVLPLTNRVAVEQYKKTVVKGASVSDILSLVPSRTRFALEKLPKKRLSIWGLTGFNQNNLVAWGRLRYGDYALFVYKGKIIFQGKIVQRLNNARIAEQLWGKNKQGHTWNLLLFINEGEEIESDPLSADIGIDMILGNPQLFLKNDEKTTYLLSLIGADDDDGSIRMLDADEKAASEKIDEFLEDDFTSMSPENLTKTITESISSDVPAALRIKSRRINATCMSRNRRIANFVKQRAGYKCEICGQPGFKQKNGEIYAEAHHWDEVARYQTDDPGRMICVCPTCHRIIHFGTEEELELRKKMIV